MLYVILLLAVAVNARAALSDYTSERPVLFGIAMDYPPLEYIDQDGKPCGYDIEFTRDLMRRLKLPLDCEPLPWGAIPRATIEGNIDLSMMTYSTYRRDSVHYSRAVFKLYYQILYQGGNTKKHVDMRRLNGKKIAYLSSKPVSDTLKAVGAVPMVVLNLRQAAQDLENGLYDAVICYRYQAKFMKEKYGLTSLVAEDFTLMPREYCFVSHDKALIDRINEELDKMEEEGVINELYTPAGMFQDTTEIPQWIWYLLVMLTIVFLVVLVIFQQWYQKKLTREMKRAQRSEQAKTVFLGNVSHILRTPLNAINGFSEILKSDESSCLSAGERTKLATLVHDNGERLLYFIDELLTLSDIEGNELKFSRTRENLKVIMDAYADEARKNLHEGVELEVVGPENVYVYIDEKLMHLTLMHLLSNAVRFTEKGKITLTYQLKNNRLYVEVKDTGCGVPEALRKNIFSLLMDKSTAVQDAIPGLGLTICRVIVERCHGRIGYLPLPEGGSCFWHWVPIKVVK